MNSEYIGKAISYHGQPLQKIWDDERGGEELRQLGLTQMNFSVYLERQKYFTFQERAKRLKVHQFLTRKAVELYDRGLVANVMEDSVVAIGAECLVQQPPYEFFTQLKDKRKAWTYRLDALKQGSIIYASVMSLPRFNRLMVKPLCSDEPLHLYLADIPIKATIMQTNWGPLPLDKQGNPRQFGLNDILRCEVCQISSDAERLALNMIGIYQKSPDLKLGLCDIKDLPKYYRQIHIQEHPSTVHYEDMLSAAPEFENPNYDLLFQVNGLQPNENFSMMSHIKLGFPEAEYASELRQKQASQWAFRSVADGIEHFKNGQQVEAFQCLNKALNIDPRNVEGLVARGALYANRGSFLKGLQDFEKALNLNKYHVNARIYMCETLVALGRSYEEKNCIPDAVKAYNDCLNLLPQHAEARLSLDALQRCSNLPPGVAVGVGAGVADGKHTTDVVDLAQTSDESSSSSGGSESESEDQTGRARGNSTSSSAHPAQFVGGAGDDKLAIIDAEKANEFKLDEDETMSSVRRLLREANKHKKAKKKGKKKKDKKEKKTKSRSGNNSNAGDEDDDDLDPIELLKKIDIKEAFSQDKLMQNAGSDAELKVRLREYLQKGGGHNASPPPPPPSMARKQEPFGGGKRTSYDDMGPSTSRHAHAAAASTSTSIAAAAVGSNSVQVAQQVAAKFQEQKKHQQQPQQVQPTPRFSFQIKRPLQMDKFGLLRLAVPEPQKNLGRSSSSRSRSRSRSRSNRRRSERRRSSSRRRSRRDSRSRSHSTARRTRTRSHSRRRRSMSRSRSRSRSPRRYGGRFGRGRRFDRDRRSRSRSVHRRRTPSPFVPRRTPSPFVPRRTPSPASRFRRSRSRSRSRSYSPRNFQSRYTPRGRGRGRGRSQNRYAWFNHDQRTESNGRSVSPGKKDDGAAGDPKKNADGSKNNASDPTIEEVDEMIKNAQKERKQGLIEATSKDVRE
ncbi:tetratricopeptide repeat protein 14 homolog isoform X1 [Drosophila subobscura]|uniref:tetratricopeptide repeat protein 14 homolog isoform X1 n=1 Tax=Drosophila subobscura TaxID=7241 RepID=UPI00155A22B5|nr:tetratricopeptide repeat protein 14 homolog isoform X1 [Drosophila subobscura]